MARFCHGISRHLSGKLNRDFSIDVWKFHGKRAIFPDINLIKLLKTLSLDIANE